MTTLLEKRLVREVGQKRLGDTLGGKLLGDLCRTGTSLWLHSQQPPRSLPTGPTSSRAASASNGHTEGDVHAETLFCAWLLRRQHARGLKRGFECSGRALPVTGRLKRGASPAKDVTPQGLSLLWKTGQISKRQRSGFKKNRNYKVDVEKICNKYYLRWHRGGHQPPSAPRAMQHTGGAPASPAAPSPPSRQPLQQRAIPPPHHLVPKKKKRGGRGREADCSQLPQAPATWGATGQGGYQ